MRFFLDENANIIKKDAGNLLDSSEEIGLEFNAQKSLFMHRPQITGQNQYTKVVNVYFENVAEFKRRTVTNQNCIEREINSTLKSRN